MPISSSSPHRSSSQINTRPTKGPRRACDEDQPARSVLERNLSSSSSMRPQQDHKKAPGGSNSVKENRKVIRYKECRRNHAAKKGGYAVDGCREFLASGEEGTSAALNCAACNCHRNFHRKEVDPGGEDYLLNCSSDSTSPN